VEKNVPAEMEKRKLLSIISSAVMERRKKKNTIYT